MALDHIGKIRDRDALTSHSMLLSSGAQHRATRPAHSSSYPQTVSLTRGEACALVPTAIGALQDAQQQHHSLVEKDSPRSPWASPRVSCVLDPVSSYSANDMPARRCHPHLGDPISHHLNAHAKPHAPSSTFTAAASGPQRVLRTQEARAGTRATSSPSWVGGDGQGQVEQESGGERPHNIHDRLAEGTRRCRRQGKCACRQDQAADQVREG
jgi:hypothetical protein